MISLLLFLLFVLLGVFAWVWMIQEIPSVPPYTPKAIAPEDMPDMGADRVDFLMGGVVDAMLSTSKYHLLEEQ